MSMFNLNELVKVISKFLHIKKKIKFPKKSSILIYDNIKLDMLDQFLSRHDYEILNLRTEINLFILLKCLIKFKIKRKYYIIEYINFVDPRIIITFTDNDIFFYKIKNYCKNKVCTIAIQNGYRSISKDLFAAPTLVSNS